MDIFYNALKSKFILSATSLRLDRKSSLFYKVWMNVSLMYIFESSYFLGNGPRNAKFNRLWLRIVIFCFHELIS